MVEADDAVPLMGFEQLLELVLQLVMLVRIMRKNKCKTRIQKLHSEELVKVMDGEMLERSVQKKNLRPTSENK